MTYTWLTFYGLKLGMSREEIDVARYGEIVDLIACMAIFNGAAEQKKSIKDYQSAIALR